MNLKSLINNWDFANPQWESLPEGFPDCDLSGLTTKQDKHLFEAIKTAWIISAAGRQYFYKKVAKHAAVAVTIIFVLLAGKNLIKSNQTFTKTVNAKTVGQVVGEIVQATMSAVFK